RAFTNNISATVAEPTITLERLRLTSFVTSTLDTALEPSTVSTDSVLSAPSLTLDAPLEPSVVTLDTLLAPCVNLTTVEYTLARAFITNISATMAKPTITLERALLTSFTTGVASTIRTSTTLSVPSVPLAASLALDAPLEPLVSIVDTLLTPSTNLRLSSDPLLRAGPTLSSADSTTTAA